MIFCRQRLASARSVFDPYLDRCYRDSMRIVFMGTPDFAVPADPGIQAHDRALPPLLADRRVEGDPVEPSEELGIAFESRQRLVGVHERILYHIQRIVRVVHNPVRHMIKAILVPQNQLSE